MCDATSSSTCAIAALLEEDDEQMRHNQDNICTALGNSRRWVLREYASRAGCKNVDTSKHSLAVEQEYITC